MTPAELRKNPRCACCHKPLLHSGLPLIWRITVERLGVDVGALRRFTGLETMLGSGAMAVVLSPDARVTTTLMEPVTLLVCDPCGLGHRVVHAAMERSAKEDGNANQT